MTTSGHRFKEYDFTGETCAGLFLGAGGFEQRAIAFNERLRKSRCMIEEPLLISYESQRKENQPNFDRMMLRLKEVTGKEPETVSVNADTPIQSCRGIKKKIENVAIRVTDRRALIDVSGMTHLWALSAIHACISCGLQTTFVYTEARYYFPPKKERKRVAIAWGKRQYDVAATYLQSAGLKAVNILPEWGGNFRPGRQTCLIVFAGYEPNRIEGLVDAYAPGALIVFYGRSPHKELQWRLQLSRELHRELFSKWYVRETEISTLLVDEMMETLDEEFRVVQEQYDVAIAPQCSKMQALASYLFWRRHPEVQLLFASPVTFNPSRYSRGARRTFMYEIG